MKHQRVGKGLVFSVPLWGALLPFLALAQDSQVGPAPSAALTTLEVKTNAAVNTAPGIHKDPKLELKADGAVKYSAGVDEILRMLQTGVSPAVVQAYIENSPTPYALSATDIIALKEHAVPDDITTALIKRGALLKAQASQPSNLNSPPMVVMGRNQRFNTLDPEGYDYFQYYYLYPRTLANANQRLFAPSSSFSYMPPYGYGNYGYLPFRPFPPSAFRRP